MIFFGGVIVGIVLTICTLVIMSMGDDSNDTI